MINAEFKIKLPDPKAAYDAIKPDLENSERFTAHASVQKGELHIKISALDLTAARAAINSYLRLINMINDVDKIN